MKREEKYLQPATEKTRIAEVRCDICGRTGKATYHPWADGSYDATDSEVKLRTGSSYPEGGSGTELQADICPDCFKTKLVPWIESFGHTKIAETDWDF